MPDIRWNTWLSGPQGVGRRGGAGHGGKGRDDAACATPACSAFPAEGSSVRAGLLSGGSRQKLNLTLALMHDPDVLLLDEPYQGFDWETYLRFWELATRLRDAGRSVLVVSHLAYDIERLDQLWRLEDGRLHHQDRRSEAAA